MPRIERGARIGHVHLKVADIGRSLAFYVGVLGFFETQRLGDRGVFLSVDGYHHDLAINTVESLGGAPPPHGTTGLFHHAILFPTRSGLAAAVKRALDAGFELTGLSDHGVSEAVYLDDPDGNGVELYWDRPKESWPRDADGNLAMVEEPLDLDGLLEAAA